MKFDSIDTAFQLIIVALLVSSVFYILHLQNILAEEMDSRQAADARAALCEGSIEALAREAREREEKAQQAMLQAQKDAKTAAHRADYELRRAADYPGDDCASAKSRAARWLSERAGQ